MKPIIETIKMLTLRALISDEELMYGLVLKGENALELAYKITDRASKDVDFSISGDFSKEEYECLIRYIIYDITIQRYNHYLNNAIFPQAQKYRVITMKIHVPVEVKKPSPTSLTERTRFAGPPSVVFPVPVFQHPRNHA